MLSKTQNIFICTLHASVIDIYLHCTVLFIIKLILHFSFICIPVGLVPEWLINWILNSEAKVCVWPVNCVTAPYLTYSANRFPCRVGEKYRQEEQAKKKIVNPSIQDLSSQTTLCSLCWLIIFFTVCPTMETV